MTGSHADTAGRIAVAIIEDRRDVRDGLHYLIDLSEDCRVSGAYADAEAALAAFPTNRPQVVLMDIELPGIDGIEATRRIKSTWPEIQVMMLTVYEDDERVFRSLEAGATGYVLKKTPPAQLVRDIATVHAGGSPMSSGIARRVVQTFHARTTEGRDIDVASLTPREEEILALLAKGFRYREIAEHLFISLDTVRTHIRHIYEKLQVRSRTEATVKYLTGWGRPPTE